MNLSASGTATLERDASLDGTATPLLEQAPRATNPRIHRFADRMHRAIDSIQERLGSGSDGMKSKQSKYGEQAREYADKVRHRFNERPLQSAGIAVASGVVLDRLFLRRPETKVRIVRVPTPVRVAPALHATSARASRAAGYAAGRATAMGSVLGAKAGALPVQVRDATQRLLGRSGLQDHPYVGLGAVLGASSLLTALWMQRRRPPASADAYVVADDKGNGVAWRHEAPDQRPRYRERIAERPIGAAVVLLGVGALAGAMLRARTT